MFELYLHLPVVFVLFQVFCTAPKRYMVVDSDGVIKPRCCIDMYVTILYYLPLCPPVQSYWRYRWPPTEKVKVKSKKYFLIYEPCWTMMLVCHGLWQFLDNIDLFCYWLYPFLWVKSNSVVKWKSFSVYNLS